MKFSEYVNRQRNIIRNNRVGEEYLIINGEVIPLRGADEILSDLTQMRGLFENRESDVGFEFSRGREYAFNC